MITKRDLIKSASTALLTTLSLTPSYSNADPLKNFNTNLTRNLPPALETSEEKVQNLLNYYETNRPEKITSERKLISDSHETIYLPSSVRGFGIPPHEIILEKYGSKGPGILISPINGKPSKLERIFAKKLSKEYQPTIITIPPYGESLQELTSKVKTQEDIDPFLFKFNIGYNQSIMDHLQAIDYLKQEVSEEVGIMGGSLGGIMASSLMGLEKETKSKSPRITAGISLMGGGNFPKILAYSQLEEIEMGRELVLTNLGKNEVWLENKLKGRINFDPKRLAHRIDGERFLLVMAGNDRDIPTGEYLEEKVEGITTWHVNGLNHKSAYISILTQTGRIKNFFDERFEN